MENSKEKFLRKLESSLPDLAKPGDIAALKIFGSKNTLISDRKAGRGLPFICVSKCRTRYPKEDVLTYVEKHFYELRGNS